MTSAIYFNPYSGLNFSSCSMYIHCNITGDYMLWWARRGLWWESSKKNETRKLTELIFQEVSQENRDIYLKEYNFLLIWPTGIETLYNHLYDQDMLNQTSKSIQNILRQDRYSTERKNVCTEKWKSAHVYFDLFTALSCTINQAIEQNFRAVLFIMPCKVNFKSVDKPYCVTIQMRAFEQYFRVVLWYCDNAVSRAWWNIFKLLFCFLTCRDHLFDHLAWIMKLFGCSIISCIVCNRYDHCATRNPLTHPSGSPSNWTLLALLKSTNAISEDGKLKSQSKQLRRQISPKD